MVLAIPVPAVRSTKSFDVAPPSSFDYDFGKLSDSDFWQAKAENFAVRYRVFLGVLRVDITASSEVSSYYDDPFFGSSAGYRFPLATIANCMPTALLL